MTFEILLVSGDRRGPFTSDLQAAQHGAINGDDAFMVAVRTDEPIGKYKPIDGYIPVKLWRREGAEWVGNGFETLHPRQIPPAFHWMLKEAVC